MNRKFIFVIGGVISGVGKGIAASSIGKILQARGFSVTALKIDPYVNVDAGTMNPTEHGEVFVLQDGDETDQDMGNYERFLDTTLTGLNYMTTGRIYQSVIERERNLEYKGKCVQVVPHIPLEAIARIKKATEKARADIAVIEVGGTVGEYENILFLEAARMMKAAHPDDVAVVMVSYLPTPPKVGEMKTKPTQHATRQAQAAGIQPDVIIARSELPLDKKRREKLATFCNILPRQVIAAPDVNSIYDIPINFEKDKLSDILLLRLRLNPKKRRSNLETWKKFVRRIRSLKNEVRIAVVGKYFNTGDFVLSDSYISVIEAIKYSAIENGKKPVISWLSAVDFEDKSKLRELSKYDGILVPGGFGERGIEGKLNVIEYAREHKIPYFGLCYGMQLLVIEYARNVLGLKGANTAEVNPHAKHLVIDVMPDQKQKIKEGHFGGTMRLGAYPAILKKDTIAEGAYGKRKVEERHRHRYEVNPDYIKRLEKGGLVFSGTSPDGKLMEIAELPREKHPFFLGTQFHPEFQARPLKPHPLFTEFIKAACLPARQAIKREQKKK
ncbi:MAG: CTP synthase [Candidatus Ryanbacteria bacterium CG10_big_fil_rev_8_21_14_0_10_43_42]|uniref:CTP synthase n=1 Tax=Candidatus Ryanbacteria bacterium CG10_big_fil_rev_8_21_14_0_10_43_42 TaxID=1974864 RepID=A0A2M8KYC0_9BACT|nr:MAG: CTP synthase [Candidatus Ryanbacteria bacterium CG10_big_fil_rev_8_21_14_0_10_43_42]